jgi:cytochrome c oxidase subunit III
MTEHAAHNPNLGHHFESLEQQHEANVFGMWVFLITEVLLFGGLFTAYFVFRAIFPQGFAEGSHHLNIVLGGINTVVLILSSLCVALAVHSVQTNNRRLLTLFLALTIVLGLIFLGIKGVEYYEHFQDHQVPGALFIYEGEHPERANAVELFNLLYFSLTGTHAVHMVIGLSLVGFMLFRSWRGKYDAEYYTPVELTGLYWHFVDIVWVFLFPMLYLIGRH